MPEIKPRVPQFPKTPATANAAKQSELFKARYEDFMARRERASKVEGAVKSKTKQPAAPAKHAKK